MLAKWKNILQNPTMYHYTRHIATGGLPIRRWARLGGLFDPTARVADLGCGPADILRYVSHAHKPAYYLGLDLSEEYLSAARMRARKANCSADFHAVDLTMIPYDSAVRQRVIDLFTEHQIDRVLLFGVLHHIDDQSAITTMNMVFSAPTVQQMVTQDVIRVRGNWINNRFCEMDRGEFIRDESTYDDLIVQTNWPNWSKTWTHPNLWMIKYIHYVLSKSS